MTASQVVCENNAVFGRHLNANELIRHLKDRFAKDEPHTLICDTLVVVNPLKPQNTSTQPSSSDSSGSQQLHTFTQNALNAILYGPLVQQCIVLRGESGAGKTETAKLCVQHLTAATTTSVKSQVLQIIPVLEAFGNACTDFNQNSSRFGCYLHLYFHADQVVGAKVNEYCLEKHRVSERTRDESNFHILHYLAVGHPQLASVSSCRYLQDGQNLDCSKMKSQCDALTRSMKLIGFTEQECTNILSSLSAVLLLGDVTFRQADAESVVVDDSSVPLTQMIAEIFGVDQADLEECLCSEVRLTAGEQIRRNYSKLEAEDCRDLIARLVYSRVFSWIIYKINLLMVPAEDSAMKEIGIVDMFGFEQRDQSGFQQMFINLTEEYLHQSFTYLNKYGVNRETYAEEGVPWLEEAVVTDSQPIIDLFISKPGILSVLDEQTQSNKDACGNLIAKFAETFKGNKHFIHSSSSSTCFIIKHHSCSAVTYNVKGWLTKNKDLNPPGVVGLLQIAENTILSNIFKAKISRTASLIMSRCQQQPPSNGPVPVPRSCTTSTFYQNSLKSLGTALASQHLIFINCIRPNRLNWEAVFDDDYVLSQIKHSGLMEAYVIFKSRFITVVPFADFVRQYGILLASEPVIQPPLACCQRILKIANISGSQIGKTRVFLTYEHVCKLNEQVFMHSMNNTSNLASPAKSPLQYIDVQVEHKSVPADVSKPVIVPSSPSSARGYADVFHGGIEQKSPAVTNSQLPVGLKETNGSQGGGDGSSGHLPPADPRRLPGGNGSAPGSQSLQGGNEMRQASGSQVSEPGKPGSLVTPNRLLGHGRLYPELPYQHLLLSSSVASAALASTSKVETVSAPANSQTTNENSDDSDSDKELIDEDFRKLRIAQNEGIYGPAGSREASVKWFKATQAKSLQQNDGAYVEWFHGIISRKQAENLLSQKPVGAFLIRVGETRTGFTLSVKDSSRCRHYMIDHLKTNCYVIVGERTTHKSLGDLVEYHKKHKLANWDKLLTVPCCQATGECNYLELVLSKEDETELLQYIFNKPRKEASAPMVYNVIENPPPASTNQCSTPITPSPNPPQRGTPVAPSPSAAQRGVSQGPPLPKRTSAPAVQQATGPPTLPVRRASGPPPLPPRTQGIQQ